MAILKKSASTYSSRFVKIFKILSMNGRKILGKRKGELVFEDTKTFRASKIKELKLYDYCFVIAKISQESSISLFIFLMR